METNEDASGYRYFHCYFCGGNLLWNSDSMAYEDDDIAIQTYYTCTNCGRDYIIIDPDKDGREDHCEYWNENE